MREKPPLLNDDINVRNTSDVSIPVRGTTNLVAKIGTSTETVCFYVGDHLATVMIIRSNLCNKYADAI